MLRTVHSTDYAAFSVFKTTSPSCLEETLQRGADFWREVLEIFWFSVWVFLDSFPLVISLDWPIWRNQCINIEEPCRRLWVRSMAGPTLRVFKKLSRKCCLCNYICKWLDFLVFSDKDDKTVGPVSQFFIVHNPAGRKRTHALFGKSGAWSSRFCGLTLLCRYLAKTWPAWLDISKKACGVWGHARKNSHKSKGFAECQNMKCKFFTGKKVSKLAPVYMEKSCPGWKGHSPPEVPWLSQLFLHFLIKLEEPFIWERKWWLGWPAY